MLSPQALETLVRHLVSRWGLSKVRLTGGEPTARPDCIEIIQRLAGIENRVELAMTTNGLTLARDAAHLRAAGLQRINVSLDSLHADTFARMTGVRGPERVVAGIHAAMEAGLAPIRLNTVVLAGENDKELPQLVRFAAARGLEIRFIELMPMGPLADQWTERFVPESAMRQRLGSIVEHWRPLEQGHDSARSYRVQLDDGRSATIGFITPMSCNFCAACNRLRLTASGDVYPCLMDRPRGNILPALVAYRELPGLEGATYYYYEIPDNEVNDWLVETHFERFDSPPDFFTAGGMAAGIAVVEAIRAAGGAEDTEALIEAVEGMSWETPKGTMTFRPEDHQALQSMCHFRTEVRDGVDYGVPVLVRELGIEDLPAVEVGDRHLGGGDQVELVALAAVGVLGELGELARPGHDLRPDQERDRARDLDALREGPAQLLDQPVELF